MGHLTKEILVVKYGPNSENFEHELKPLNIIINNEKTLVGFLNYIFNYSINCNNTKYIHQYQATKLATILTENIQKSD